MGEEVRFSEFTCGLREDYDFFSLLHPAENRTRLWMLVLYGVVRTHGFREIVELGTRLGVTTAFLARAAQLNSGRVLTVDIDPEATAAARARLDLLGLAHVVEFQTRPSAQDPRPADFLFIDADHRYPQCKDDWDMWSPHVRPGGIVAIHDTNDPQVARMVREINLVFWDVMDFPGDCGMTFARRIG